MRHLAGLASLLVLLNISCRTAPAPTTAAAVAPSYTSQAGEIPVGVVPSGALRDDARERTLDLAIEYPIQAGSYPVVIFSTGFGVPSRSYVALSSYWASHGYVVIKVRHPGLGPEVTDLAEVWRDQTPEDWRNRARDISFLIDSFPTLEQQYPELKGKLDVARVGVGGHSYGAFTTMLVAGTQTFTAGMPTTYADSRVKAAVAMSAPGPGPTRGLTTESWRDVQIPVMYMTGSADRGATEAEDAAWYRQPYELSRAGDKWFVSLAGAGHLTFAGRVLMPVATDRPEMIVPSDPRDPRDPRRRVPTTMEPRTVRRVDGGFYNDRHLIGVVRTVSLAFWDAYLKNEAAGRTYLAGLNARGDMTVETK